jgi:arylformamidase
MPRDESPGPETDVNESAYRGMTPDELVRQYSPRLSVPEHPRIFARWQLWSTDYRAVARAELDVAYGEGPDETLDLFMPEAEGPPIHVFLHGGYWQSLHKDDFSFLARALVEAGVAVAVVNYALCPAVTLDEIVDQTRRALAFVWREGRRFGCEPSNIQVSGHSAGGQLTAMMVATDWPAFAADLPADLVKSGVPVSGVFELEPLRHTPINDALALDAEAARRNSPALLKPAWPAPLAFAVGGAESAEFHRQSRDFAACWADLGCPVEHVEAPDCNHFTVVEQMAIATSPLARAMLRLLKR